VAHRRMKHMAENVADQVSGVREIHNQLRVSRDRAA
jgi:osmotically-inducible protein OsmY